MRSKLRGGIDERFGGHGNSLRTAGALIDSILKVSILVCILLFDDDFHILVVACEVAICDHSYVLNHFPTYFVAFIFGIC